MKIFTITPLIILPLMIIIGTRTWPSYYISWECIILTTNSKSIKILAAFLLSSSIVGVSTLSSASAESLAPATVDKFEKYRNEIIQDELAYPQNDNNATSRFSVDNKLTSLENAEIVELVFDQEGVLLSADSSEGGDVTERFVEKPASESIDMSTKNNTPIDDSLLLSDQLVLPNSISPLSAIPNPSSAPSGAEGGAFYRISTKASTSLSTSYTGLAASSITLPVYNVTDAMSGTKTEAAYLYTGIDPGIAEVGLGTTKQVGLGLPAGWYPVFHARATHSITSGDNNGLGNSAQYYYDSSRRYDGGAVISGYKVYYKYNEATLNIRFILGTQIYEVLFPGTNSTGKSVKRLTTIAMNGMNGQNDLNQKFKVPFQTYSVWNNTQFLYNNGTQAFSPSSLPGGVTTQTWNHGGILDYVVSGTSESIKIY